MRIAKVLPAWRHHEEMTIRVAADRIGIAGSTYARLEMGYPMSGGTLATILRWMLEG